MSSPVRAVAALVAAAVLALVVVSPGRALGSDGCPGCGVSTGPDRYVGALLIPPGSHPVPASLPATAARCDGCVWTLEPACQRPGDTGGIVCPGALFACPAPQLRLAVLLQRPGDPVARRVGTFCHDSSVWLQPAELVPGVRDRFVRLLPPATPSFQPRDLGVVNVPVLFAAGQDATLRRHAFALGGHAVVLDATASWRWTFGDGVVLTTTRPGGGWPDTDVAHLYPRPGTFVVTLTTTWDGRFWVDGSGPFQVTGAPVTQAVVVGVPVRSARAVLLGVDPVRTAPGPGGIG